jgi:MoaA/NifB/PqqE/SkfB family radical SAM enzyme
MCKTDAKNATNIANRPVEEPAGTNLTNPIPRRSNVKTLGPYSYLIRYYVASLFGQKRPILGGIKLTHACNLSCTQCPFRQREAISLSFPQALSALRTLHDWGVRILIIEGGEPFLWRDEAYDLSDIVAQARKLFFTVGVTTNGTFPIEVDSDIVWISIDGMQETHDRLRGKSFERIMANLKATMHPKVYAHMTINALNWREVPELVAFLSDKVKGITVQFHYPYQEVTDKLLLPPDQRRQVLDDLIRLKRRGLPIANSYACLQALKENRWRCRPWMIASVDPDGQLTHGCYVKNRGEVACEQCGFSAHTEISLAYGWRIGPLLTGHRIFLAR